MRRWLTTSGGAPPWGHGAELTVGDGVLLLNASYEPLGVVSARRAVVLISADRVDAFGERQHPLVFRSPSSEIAVPAIVRLRVMVAAPRTRRTPPPTRRGILRRDGGRCAYCRGAADTVDHIVPKSRGGASTWSNLVAACRYHNALKGDRLLGELGWALSVTPSVPLGVRQLGGVHAVEPSWISYLGAEQTEATAVA